jgi:methylmalonyl-CoA mutase C-terminal domain/subunit
MQRRIRVLVGKPGLDGHDRGAKVVAAALRDAGMEVIYTGLHQTPEQVVEAGVQEDVDVVALSILSGAHMTLFPAVQRLMEERGIGDRLLTGGGIIPPDDMKGLADAGIGRLFGPGSSTEDIITYIRDWFAGRHGADALTPLPERPAIAGPSTSAFPMPTAAELRHHHAPAKKPAPKRTKPAKKSKPAPRKKVAKAPAKKSAPKRKPAKKSKPAPKKKVAKTLASKRKPAAKPKARPKAKPKPAPKKQARRR